MKARLLLQVADREPVEVCAFTPKPSLVNRGNWWREGTPNELARLLEAALTVEIHAELDTDETADSI